MITKTGDKPTLADVDGTVPGRAMLLCIRLDEDRPDQMYNLFEETPDAPADPWTFAEGLMRSIEGDFPEHEWAIVGNWRAKYLRWELQMKRTIPGEFTPQEYLETFR